MQPLLQRETFYDDEDSGGNIRLEKIYRSERVRGYLLFNIENYDYPFGFV